MDERRFAARTSALRQAVLMITGGGRNSVNSSDFVTQVADVFEEWLMRPVPGPVVPAELLGDGPARQPCGAFLQPPWFLGTLWLTCSGEHRPEDGWHIGRAGSARVTFRSHHAPDHVGPQRCTCGGTEIPCPDAHPTDMHR